MEGGIFKASISETQYETRISKIEKLLGFFDIFRIFHIFLFINDCSAANSQKDTRSVSNLNMWSGSVYNFFL